MKYRRQPAIVKSAESFRETAEKFIALADVLSKTKVPPEQEQQKALLLAQAQQAVAMVRGIMSKADNVRTWARDVFGDKVDNAPLMEFASRQIVNSVNATLGYQTYRIRAFLKSGIIEQPRQHLRGNIVASLAASLLNEAVK